MTYRSLLAVLMLGGQTTAAPSAAPMEPPPVVQEFLAVPTWYLNYRIIVECRAPANPAESRHTSLELERVTTGSAQLGIRSSGPSLSVIGGTVPTSGAAYLDIIDLFANWIGGSSLDEDKSEAEQDAEFNRVMEANRQAFQRYWSRSESVGDSGFNRTTRAGSAPVISLADFHFEIDARKRRYQFKFASGFADSEHSMTAVRGETISFGGTPNEHRQAIVTSLDAGTEPVVAGTMPSSFIEGDLPASFGNISGTSSFPIRLVRGDAAGFPGIMRIQYTLSPRPPEDLELVVIPPAAYEQWRPLGGLDETTPGDIIPVKVRLQKRDGTSPQTKALRFNCRLEETSREKGVCLNWPLRAAADPARDLQFEPGRNPDHDIGDNERQSASREGMSLTDDTVVLSCFDYGASTRFVAEAELEDGRTILGVVQGTQLEFLNLPKRAAGSRIAAAFLDDQGVPGLTDADDGENDPVGDGFKGDGLTLYEEYRGFHHGGEWMPGDPKVKDVFVLNLMRGMTPVTAGIGLFETVTRLRVHQRLRAFEVNDGMVINFNHTDAPHAVDQHVIRLLGSQSVTRATAAGFVEKVGTPGTAKAVRIRANLETLRTVGARTYDYFAATLAHEMLHSCNVYHHGEADQDVEWTLSQNPAPHVVESGPGGTSAVIVQLESGVVVPAPALFAAYATGQPPKFTVTLGVPHGQHSGMDDCLMRYDNSWGYASVRDSRIRYLLPDGEAIGTTLCITTAGTGVNSPGHRPQSRYHSAATAANGGPAVLAPRGNCKLQFRVNDLGEEPKR